MSDPIDRQDVLRKMESVMDMQELYLPVHFKEWVIDECPTVDAVPRKKYEEDMENAFAHGYTDSESNFRKMIAYGELVEVVRCKDCIHFNSEDDCDCPMDVRYSDFFCKMGERRTDG